MKLSVRKNPVRWLCSTGLILLFGAGFSLNANAQFTCSGDLGIQTDLTTPLFIADLPETVQVTLTPRVSSGSEPMDIHQLRYSLVCTNNQDAVPCAFGSDEDPDNPGELPIDFVGLVGGTCPNLSTTGPFTQGNDDGRINFDIAGGTTIDTTGCTIIFDVSVKSKGSDASPLLLTPAAAFSGTCDTAIGEIEGSAAGSFILPLLDPRIEVTKEGPDVVKVGDDACYSIKYDDVGDTPVGNCTGDDDVLGFLGDFDDGVTREFCRAIEADDDNPLVNTVTITCDALNAAGTAVVVEDAVSEFASHSVAHIDPQIVVTKEGPDSAKVGDEITYTIGFTASGFADEGPGSLGECTGYDTLLSDLGTFEDGVTQDFPYTVQEGDENPLPNRVDITCEIEGFANEASDYAEHEVDLILPDVSLTKECRPETVLAGEEITWAITVENTGNVALNCELSDPTAEIDEAFPLDPGESKPFSNSRLVSADDAPTISNTARVDCHVGDDLENAVYDEDEADCDVEVPGEAICRTPGFWGTHGGEERRGRGREGQNLTQAVIDAAGGSIEVCGATIDNTDVPDPNSAIEAMCVVIEGEQIRQLGRQLTAMALNCVVSGFGADCSGDAALSNLFEAANTACANEDENLGDYIEPVDCFNNGGQFDFDEGVCSFGFPDNCHDRDLTESDIFDDVGGPAGSPRACSEATGNGVKVFPAIL